MGRLEEAPDTGETAWSRSHDVVGRLGGHPVLLEDCMLRLRKAQGGRCRGKAGAGAGGGE